MRIGCTGNKERIASLKECGFDYAELALWNFVDSSEEDILEIEKLLAAAGLKAEVFNCFFPKAVKLMGAEANPSEIAETVDRNLRILTRFGAKVAVVGSGKSREIPEGYTKENAMEAFAQVMNVCCDRCASEGIRVTVEPLARKDTNFINTVTDAVEFGEYLKNPNLGYLVDFYHFALNEEPLEELDLLKGRLDHVHIARGNTDRLPPMKEDEETVRAWMQKLKDVGYHDRITYECRFQPDLVSSMQDSIKMFPLLREV